MLRKKQEIEIFVYFKEEKKHNEIIECVCCNRKEVSTIVFEHRRTENQENKEK